MRGRQTFAILKALQSEVYDPLTARDEAQFSERATSLLHDESARGGIHADVAENSRKLFADPAPVAALHDWVFEHTRS